MADGHKMCLHYCDECFRWRAGRCSFPENHESPHLCKNCFAVFEAIRYDVEKRLEEQEQQKEKIWGSQQGMQTIEWRTQGERGELNMWHGSKIVFLIPPALWA